MMTPNLTKQMNFEQGNPGEWGMVQILGFPGNSTDERYRRKVPTKGAIHISLVPERLWPHPILLPESGWPHPIPRRW
jgi:hypothetical protein